MVKCNGKDEANDELGVIDELLQNYRPFDDLVFGSPEAEERHWVYARYACGDPISKIAADRGMSMEQIYQIMRSCPDEYEATKKRREDFTGLRITRSQALIDAWNLRFLEDMTEGRVLVTAELLKEVSKINKDLTARVQLFQGKANFVVEARDGIKTNEALLKLCTAVKAAGDALDLSSIEGSEQ
ncbi:hypothetical protein KAR91_44910 [Candidatus Pacearchaeota archaeon]|nr:hypothetical protein [Candidatus Pacearchaeota archaeon]